MPTIRTSEEGRRLAEARWRKHREREAEAWADDALSLAILTEAQEDRLIGDLLRQGAESALAEVAPSIVVAAAELGLCRATAERLADLAMLLTAVAIERAGGPEVALPTPEAWRATVAWDAIFSPSGESLVVGEIARESQAETAEPTGRD
ncbi:hypothetical protein KO353_05625 [Elioraea tepida]|uniref:Uncharacterized protein n=1 Tax=Elioraea tepida TaxID=2843330 RepID=A0A975U3H8_9PROT|nr:hypothetical protein [Elioraea tepida]QXM25685.1 hypothetical protein KO353_05625 [Elioraea tepida]